jgi:Domain of unknown function (DUF397)
MRPVDLTQANWQKSTYSSGNGQCVEVAFLSSAIAVRDSKDPEGSALVFTPGEWDAFVRGVADGQLRGPLEEG